jgi:hypothetical protein
VEVCVKCPVPPLESRGGVCKMPGRGTGFGAYRHVRPQERCRRTCSSYNSLPNKVESFASAVCHGDAVHRKFSTGPPLYGQVPMRGTPFLTKPAQSFTVAHPFPSSTSRCLLGHRGCAHGRPSLVDGTPVKWRRRKGGKGGGARRKSKQWESGRRMVRHRQVCVCACSPPTSLRLVRTCVPMMVEKNGGT